MRLEHQSIFKQEFMIPFPGVRTFFLQKQEKAPRKQMN